MANYKKGILGGFNGKVGNIIGYSRYGKDFMRSLASHVRNPKSAEQLKIRARFKELTQLGSAFKAAIALGMSELSKENRNTTGNSFFKENWPRVTVDNQGVVQVQFAALEICNGDTPLPTFGRPDTSTEGKLKVSWTGDSTYGGDSNDQVYIFLYNPSLQRGLLSAPALRSGSTIEMIVPSTWSGSRVHVYGFALGGTKQNMGSPSHSQYLGEHELE